MAKIIVYGTSMSENSNFGSFLKSFEQNLIIIAGLLFVEILKHGFLY